MSIFGNLFKSEPKPRDDNSDPFVDAVVNMTTSDASLYVGAGALKNSDIFSAIRKISGDIAGNQIIYDDNSQQGNRLTNLLNKAPNNDQNAWSFWFALMCSCLLNGNSYARIVRNNSGQVTALIFLPNNEVTVTQDDDTNVLTYHYKNRKFTSREILHFKVFTQDGYKGISPIYALHDQIDIQHSKDDTVTKYFQHGYIGKSILKVMGADLGAEAKQEIRDKFLQANKNDSGVIVLDDNTDYKNLPVDKSVVAVANAIDWTTRQVASAFGLPVEVLGVENEHSSNEQSMLNYLQSTLTYYFRCITSELDAKLATGNYHFSFDTSKLFTADTTIMYKMYENAIKNGLLTPNEARSKLGLPPITGGDSLQGIEQPSTNENLNNETPVN